MTKHMFLGNKSSIIFRLVSFIVDALYSIWYISQIDQTLFCENSKLKFSY